MVERAYSSYFIALNKPRALIILFAGSNIKALARFNFNYSLDLSAFPDYTRETLGRGKNLSRLKEPQETKK